VEVSISRQNYRSSLLPTNSSTFRCLELSRHVRRGETSGGKSGNSLTTIYRVGTISLQAVVHPQRTLGALNMKEEIPFSVSYPNMPWDLQVWRKSTPG